MNKFDQKLIGKEGFQKSRKLNNIYFKATDPNNIDDKTILDLPIEDLYSFENHPFRVNDNDQKMIEILESIAKQGVINPIIVRQLDNKEGFQIISGHRRVRACDILEIKTIPAIFKKLDDEDSTILMVDSNIQREELLFSEKAFAYKMKLDALKRTAGRPKNNNNYSQLGNHFETTTSSQEMSMQVGESKNQIFRYIRLTNLIPELLYRTDEKKLPFTVSVELSYLSNDEQYLILSKIQELRNPTLAEAKKLREYSLNTGVTIETINNLFEESNLNKLDLKNKPLKRMLIKNDVLKKYFEEEIEEKELEKIILNLLELHYTNKL